MGIWNYDIKRNIKTSVKYKQWDLAVWEDSVPLSNSTADRRYYVTPPAIMTANSAQCNYVPITGSYDVTYEIQLWERELPRAVVENLAKININVREDQIHPLPFYQARVVWNNPEEQLRGLKLTSAWTNNLQQSQTYHFRVTAENNSTCQLLVATLQTNPYQFVGSIQLQFAVSAAKIDSKQLEVKSEHVVDSQLVAALKNMPGVDGPFRYLSSDDYNRMLLQIANQVVAREVVSGDYVDADDELSLKDTIASMLNTQKENTAQFDDKMWNSVFWNPLDERPDEITRDFNKYLKINQTDSRVYFNQSGSQSTSGSAALGFLKTWFSASGSGSHSSSSSMTTDDIRKYFEAYDIQSDIQGDKFIPKKLDLIRVNTNDLLRKDALTTTRVRIRQVDIGGVLQIGVGNSTLGETEDENRHLRQQLTDMQEKLTKLQASVDDLVAKQTAQHNDGVDLRNVVNSMKPPIDKNTNDITNLINGLAHSASSDTTNKCSRHTTPVFRGQGKTIEWFDQFDVRCPDGKVLTHFRGVTQNDHNDVYCEYFCCTLI